MNCFYIAANCRDPHLRTGLLCLDGFFGTLMTSCGSTTPENGTYFVNSGYPSTYDATGSCELTVIKSHSDVCQI
ncbi:jg23010, partial [Pararge aegeria aegeria]